MWWRGCHRFSFCIITVHLRFLVRWVYYRGNKFLRQFERTSFMTWTGKVGNILPPRCDESVVEKMAMFALCPWNARDMPDVSYISVWSHVTQGSFFSVDEKIYYFFCPDIFLEIISKTIFLLGVTSKLPKCMKQSLFSNHIHWNSVTFTFFYVTNILFTSYSESFLNTDVSLLYLRGPLVFCFLPLREFMFW